MSETCRDPRCGRGEPASELFVRELPFRFPSSSFVVFRLLSPSSRLPSPSFAFLRLSVGRKYLCQLPARFAYAIPLPRSFISLYYLRAFSRLCVDVLLRASSGHSSHSGSPEKNKEKQWLPTNKLCASCVQAVHKLCASSVPSFLAHLSTRVYERVLVRS